jgi:hypothetical protein
VDTARYRVIKIAVERKVPAGRGSTFERGFGEIARFGIEVRCAISIPVTLSTVAENAVALIERLPMLGVSHQMANVALLRVARQRAK